MRFISSICNSQSTTCNWQGGGFKWLVKLKPAPKKGWAFFLHLTTYASRFTIKKVRVIEGLIERRNWMSLTMARKIQDCAVGGEHQKARLDPHDPNLTRTRWPSSLQNTPCGNWGRSWKTWGGRMIDCRQRFQHSSKHLRKRSFLQKANRIVCYPERWHRLKTVRS